MTRSLNPSVTMLIYASSCSFKVRGWLCTIDATWDWQWLSNGQKKRQCHLQGMLFTSSKLLSKEQSFDYWTCVLDADCFKVRVSAARIAVLLSFRKAKAKDVIEAACSKFDGSVSRASCLTLTATKMSRLSACVWNLVWQICPAASTTWWTWRVPHAWLQGSDNHHFVSISVCIGFAFWLLKEACGLWMVVVCGNMKEGEMVDEDHSLEPSFKASAN